LHNNFINFNNTLPENLLEAYQLLESHKKLLLYFFFPADSRLPRSHSLCKKPSSPPWWNDTCQLAVEERKRITRNYIMHPTPANFLAYKTSDQNALRSLKNKKGLAGNHSARNVTIKLPLLKSGHL